MGLIDEWLFVHPKDIQDGLIEATKKDIVANVPFIPGCGLWFTDGTNADGKVVANPNIGYGAYSITYADGSSREFYRIGLSANTTGISVYVLGLDDKTYLARTYGGSIGKARVTGYCIKFRHLAAINVDVLQAAIHYGMSIHQAG